LLNHGHKQLIYLAKALMRQNKIIIFEESEESPSTDKLILTKLMTNCKGSTVIVFSRNPQSVIEMDRVLVLKDGSGIEYDHPFKLLANDESDIKITGTGRFAKLVEKAGKPESEEMFEVAKQKCLK